VVVDAVSLGEIERALAAGFTPRGDNGTPGIVFTADLIDEATLARVVSRAIPVNAARSTCCTSSARASPGHPVWLRINPGFGHGHSNKTNTGGEHSKHGIWHTDLPLAVAAMPPARPATGGACTCTSARAWTTPPANRCAMPWSTWCKPRGCKTWMMQAISAGGGLSIPYRDG
jgi:diaminopimelate decarboxylase